jgi:hypothetical protein
MTMDLITKMATSNIWEDSIYTVDTLEKGMIHIPGGMEQDSENTSHYPEVCNLKYILFWKFPFNIFRP